MLKLLRGCAVVVAVSAVLAGCNGSDGKDDATGTSIAVDPSLTEELVTKADFTTGWSVQDVSKKMSESQNKSKGDTVPADCDSRDKTSLSSGAGAMVSETQGTPGVIVALSREHADSLVAETEDWLTRCTTFSVKGDGSSADVTVRRIEPPASMATSQVGFEMDTTGRSGGESVHVSVTGYTAQVGDVIVMCIAMGGEAASPNGRDVVRNIPMLDTVFAKQVDKVKNAS
jgi:hypothetical protein